MLSQIRMLDDWHSSLEGECSLEFLFEMLFPDKYLEQRLDVSIIDENELADEASTELAAIRRKISNAELKIRETLDKMIRSASTQKYLQNRR